MKKATTPFTNDQYEILKKQFIADTLGQIQMVILKYGCLMLMKKNLL